VTDFVAIDVETANSFMGSICQIGAVRFAGGVEVEAASWLINPDDYFDEINVGIHGITQACVSGSPKFAELHSVLCMMLTGSLVVSHTHFDRTSIGQACAANGLDGVGCQWLDTAKIARRAWPGADGGYGLSALARRFGIEFRHHDAVEDARACGLILLRAIADSGLTLPEWTDRVKRPINPSSVNFRRTGDGDGPLLGEMVVFTGALNMPRRIAADRAHELGAAVEPAVTKHTTILVVGDQDLSRLAGHEMSSKHRKALSLIRKGQPIRIVAERDFMAFSED